VIAHVCASSCAIKHTFAQCKIFLEGTLVQQDMHIFVVLHAFPNINIAKKCVA